MDSLAKVQNPFMETVTLVSPVISVFPCRNFQLFSEVKTNKI